MEHLAALTAHPLRTTALCDKLDDAMCQIRTPQK